MSGRGRSTGLMALFFIISLLLIWQFFPSSISTVSGMDWTVSDDGFLEYKVSTPAYNLSPGEGDENSTMFAVEYYSRDKKISALLRIPEHGLDGGAKDTGIPGIVLLPGATITKEQEQGLARHLAELGYVTITLDQRNLGMVDAQGDLQMFLEGFEPTGHKMVYDALAAAEILRSLPKIDPKRIIYAGESNGGRFAIIACALDRAARGVLAISTCGYDTDAAVASPRGMDKDMIRFYRSIDPETYLPRIAPRPLIMIHSRNDTIIPYRLAERTYALGSQPKRLYTVDCAKHGYCTEMDRAIEEELKEQRPRKFEGR